MALDILVFEQPMSKAIGLQAGVKRFFALSLIKNNEMSFWHFRIHILEEKSLPEFLKIF